MTALKQQSVYAAAAHILRAPTLAWIMEGNLDDERGRINWSGIMAPFGNLSGGEKALVTAALAIWRDDPVMLDLRNLDDASVERVLQALMALRPRAVYTRAATEIAQEAIGMFIERLDSAGVYLVERPHLADRVDPEDLRVIRDEAVQEIREGMAVRDEDIR